LLKKYNKLWVFGDSYSTPGLCVEPQDSFWMLTAQALGIDSVYNYSRAGNSFEAVAHALISDSKEYDWENDFFLIGIPPLVRLALVCQDSTYSHHRQIFDIDANKIDNQMILCLHGIESVSFYNDPTAVRFEDPSWTQIQALRTIFLLNGWLDSKNANYLLVNLSKEFQANTSATGSFLIEQCLNHPRNLIFNNTYYSVNLNVNKPADFDQYGWSGHQGSAENKHFFNESIYPSLTKNNLL
jgi:hypothetical protein